MDKDGEPTSQKDSHLQDQSHNQNRETYRPIPPDEIPIPKIETEGIGNYVSFKPSLRDLSVSFEHPENWVAREEQGTRESYQQVIVHGPRNPSDTFTTTLTYRTMPIKIAGGYYKDLEHLKQWRLTQHSRGQDLEVSNETVRLYMEISGIELELKYRVHAGRPVLQPPLTTIQKHLFLIQIGDRLHELQFSADEKLYPLYHEVFERALQSLQLPRDS